MKTFIGNLFDFKFENFITKSVASVLYAAMVIIVCLAAVVGFVVSLIRIGDFGFAGVLMLLAVPVSAILVLTLLRVGFESSIALVTIAINTKK
jgi:hypothetical protein